MTGRTPSDDRVVKSVRLISKKWHPVIIQVLLEDGPLRFNELRDSVEGVSDKVLTESLNDLQENDLVERTVVSDAPRRVEYDLTRAGRELQAVIESLADWGQQNLGVSSRPGILVVDDDPRLAQMHAEWLGDKYDVQTAFNGKQAISRLSDDIDAVILDRRMPGLSGDELLSKIREAGLDCRVILLTAVRPGIDVSEMPFDAYLQKPGDRSTINEVVDEVLERADTDDRVLEYYSLAARRALLESELPVGVREQSDRYQQLLDRIAELERELNGDDVPDNEQIETVLDTTHDS